MNTVQNIIKYQDSHKLTNKEMSVILNISESQYSRLKDGYRQPGNDLWCGVLNGLPQFALDILDDLRVWKVQVRSVKHQDDVLTPGGNGLTSGGQRDIKKATSGGRILRKIYFRTERISKRSHVQVRSTKQKSPKTSKTTTKGDCHE